MQQTSQRLHLGTHSYLPGWCNVDMAYLLQSLSTLPHHTLTKRHHPAYLATSRCFPPEVLTHRTKCRCCRLALRQQRPRNLPGTLDNRLPSSRVLPVSCVKCYSFRCLAALLRCEVSNLRC